MSDEQTPKINTVADEELPIQFEGGWDAAWQTAKQDAQAEVHGVKLNESPPRKKGPVVIQLGKQQIPSPYRPISKPPTNIDEAEISLPAPAPLPPRGESNNSLREAQAQLEKAAAMPIADDSDDFSDCISEEEEEECDE